MKKNLNKLSLSLFILAVVTITACKKFLETAPQGQISVDAIATDPAAAENLVTGVYNSLWDGNMHGFNYVGMTNIASDDADKGSNAADGAATFGAVDDLTMDASNGLLNSVWSAHFRTIARANQALDKIPLSPASQATKDRLTAEVRFLRAYSYFNLVRFWGGVPIINGVPSVDQFDNPQLQERATKQQTYDFIISDLEFAKNILPIKGQTPTGRVTKAAAMGLLAKVYLYQQNWQRAFELSDSVAQNFVGSYSLLPSYQNIWRQVGANSSESVFEVQTGVNLACNAAISQYTVCQGPRAGGKRGWSDLGFGFGGPSLTLLNEYEAGDLRRDATIIFISTTSGTVLWDGFRIPRRDSVENDRYSYKAYHSRTAESFCGSTSGLPKNLRILRLGEILLIRAEAALAKTIPDPATALLDINSLRARAGLPPLVTIDRDSIWHERRIEMAMEHDRFFDLIRQNELVPGRAATAFTAHGKTWVANKNEVFPIPAVQIQLSGLVLKQNPGY